MNSLITHCWMIGSYSSFHVLQWLRENVSITLNIKKKWILVDVMLELLCNYEHSFLIIHEFHPLMMSVLRSQTIYGMNLQTDIACYHACSVVCRNRHSYIFRYGGKSIKLIMLIVTAPPLGSFCTIIPLLHMKMLISFCFTTIDNIIFLANPTIAWEDCANVNGPWSWLSELGSTSLTFIVKLDRVTW